MTRADLDSEQWPVPPFEDLCHGARSLLDCCIQSGPQHVHAGSPFDGMVNLQRCGLITLVPMDREWHAVHTRRGYLCWKGRVQP